MVEKLDNIDGITEEIINEEPTDIKLDREEITLDEIIFTEQSDSDEPSGLSLENAINNKELIIICKYIPFNYKQIIVDDVKKSCIIKEDGITKIDYGLQTLVTEYLMVLQYTNIDLPESNFVDTYDLLKSNGIVSEVMYSMPIDEFNMLIDMINDEIDQEIKLANQLEIIVSKFLNDLISKLPETKSIEKWVKQLVGSVKNFDASKYEKLQELLTYSKSDGKPKS
jgi:hypothetical protein